MSCFVVTLVEAVSGSSIGKTSKDINYRFTVDDRNGSVQQAPANMPDRDLCERTKLFSTSERMVNREMPLFSKYEMPPPTRRSERKVEEKKGRQREADIYSCLELCLC